MANQSQSLSAAHSRKNLASISFIFHLFHILYFILYNLYFIFYIPYFIFYILYFIFYILYFIFYILYFIFHISYFIFHFIFFTLFIPISSHLLQPQPQPQPRPHMQPFISHIFSRKDTLALSHHVSIIREAILSSKSPFSSPRKYRRVSRSLQHRYTCAHYSYNVTYLISHITDQPRDRYALAIVLSGRPSLSTDTVAWVAAGVRCSYDSESQCHAHATLLTCAFFCSFLGQGTREILRLWSVNFKKGRSKGV